MGNATCDWPQTAFDSIDHNSLGSAIQTVLYSSKNMPIQAMSNHFLPKNAVGNYVKDFIEV